MDHPWAISSPWRHTVNRRGPQAAKEHWGNSCQHNTEQQGQLSPLSSPNLLCPVLLQPCLRSSDCDRLYSSQPIPSHHLVNLLLEEKSPSVVILELD